MNSTPTRTATAPPMVLAQAPLTVPHRSVVIPSLTCSKPPQSRPSAIPEIRRMVFNDSPQWSGRGIPMAELLSCPVDELRKKINRFDDHTILEILLMHIQIKILWPGYAFLDFTHRVYLSEPGAGGVSCKGELAIEVAKAYDAFLKQAAHTPLQTNCQHHSLLITPNGPFTVSNLALKALHNQHDGVFVAEVELIRVPIMRWVQAPGRMPVLVPAVQGVPGTHNLLPAPVIAPVTAVVAQPPVSVGYAHMPAPTSSLAGPSPVAAVQNNWPAQPSRMVNATPRANEVITVKDDQLTISLGPVQW